MSEVMDSIERGSDSKSGESPSDNYSSAGPPSVRGLPLAAGMNPASAAGAERTANRVFFEKELLDESLVHYGDLLRGRSVRIGEAASTNNRLPDRLKRLVVGIVLRHAGPRGFPLRLDECRTSG
jgi:hypothetical protein